MRKKESWMRKGNIVSALGKLGTIKKIQECELDDGVYVYTFDIAVPGNKSASGRYHCDDVQEANN